MARVKLVIRLGTDSGSITLKRICMGDAPMDWAASMMLGFTSLRLPSTSRAIKGKAAITRGTMDATSPTAVPTMARVRGMTTTTRIRNGTERRRLMITLMVLIRTGGQGLMPFLSPTTSTMPRGIPIRMANRVARMVTNRVCQVAARKSLWIRFQASWSFSGVKALAKFM